MNILYEDAYLLVCCKAPGMLSAPKEGKTEESLLSSLLTTHGEVYPVHRLDRQTGGLMVFAKTRAAAAALSQAAAGDGLKKEYLTVLEGQVNEEGHLEDLLFFDRRRDKTYVVDRMRRGVKEARLSYTPLSTRQGDTAWPTLSLLRVTLLTGRTHQIRAQFAARRLPLFGDARYGAATRGPLGLFAAALTFSHPQDGHACRFTALPQGLLFSLFEEACSAFAGHE